MNDDRPVRDAPIAKPSEERTADQSTQEAGGLHGVRPGPGPELARESDADDVLNRNDEGRYETPRRYDENDAGDATMPANDSTLNTKI